MKPCTIYGCAAAAPRNSKVCFEHIKAGLLSNPLEVHFDRGASSLSFTNNTDKEISISATMYSGGGLWTLDRLISHEMDNEILDNIIREANGLPPKGGYGTEYPPTTVTPTPGKSYRIRYGDTLLTVSVAMGALASWAGQMAFAKGLEKHDGEK